MKIVHIINDLSAGGAEMMLYKLLSKINRQKFDTSVISLKNTSTLGPQIKSLGIPIYYSGMKSQFSDIKTLYNFIKLIRKLKPELIQGWMYHSNLAAFIALVFLPKKPKIVWNIRQSFYDLKNEKRLTGIIIQLCALLSGRADKIIYNSTVSSGQHELLGYGIKKRTVIPNGFDYDIFKPDKTSRLKFRYSLGFDEGNLIIGHVARYHPIKNHAGFIEAANIVHQRYPDTNFVLTGRDVTRDNIIIKNQIIKAGLKNSFFLIGERHDIPLIMPAFDIAVSSSWGEGFPNVLGEAMACGIPCVATDVGDSALIIGDTGKIVQPRNPEALASAIIELIKIGPKKRKELGSAARERIINNFSIDKIARQYEALYEEVMKE